jgi:hypothetical protein
MKYFWPFFGFLFVQILACGKGEQDAVEIVFQPIRFEIPAGTNPFQTYHFYKTDIPTQFKNTLAARGIDPSQITKIEGFRAQFDADFADANYGILYEVSIRTYQEPNFEQYTEIFYQQPIPVNAGARLFLNPSLANVLTDVQNDVVSFDIAIRPGGITPAEIPTTLTMSLKAFY